MAETIPLEMIDGSFRNRKIHRKPDWPASRYWALSGILLITISVIVYFWLGS